MMNKTVVCLSAFFVFSLAVVSNASAAPTEEKLLASDGVASDYLGVNSGNGVSISGSYAIVGANGADPSGSLSGAAYVFYYDGTDWVEQQKLTASDGAASNNFGYSVSISGDNAIVGAYYGDGNVNDSGAAYIFQYNGTQWVEQQKIIASDGAAYDRFGHDVSIFGNYVIVGAYAADGNSAGTGAAYIFYFDGTNWVEQQKLIASDGSVSDWFGVSVSISGNYAIVGAQLDDDNGLASGSVYVFDNDGTSWLEKQKLHAADGIAEDRFGSNVSISGDYMVIGAMTGAGLVSNSGAAYVFYHDGTSWIEQQKLFAYDGAPNVQFGTSVSMSGDNAVVNDRINMGAYIFHYDGNSWIFAEKLAGSDTASGDSFGGSVSIASNMVLVGAPFDDDNGSASGSAYIFTDFSIEPVFYDPDNDGFNYDVDCNNNDANFYPGAVETCDDGHDNDCDGLSDPSDPDCTADVDADNDGYGSLIDCDDNNASVNPGASEDSFEVCNDGLDNDCDSLTDLGDPACSADSDLDGYTVAEDCEDMYPFVNPGALEDSIETCNDGLDNDCDGLTDFMEPVCNIDADGDGYIVSYDCNDSDPAINPFATEICDDGLDNDCDMKADSNDSDCPADFDGDGYNTTADCDDSDASINPSAVDTPCDGIDQDCSGNDAVDATCTDTDSDGYSADVDCNDIDATINPGALEVCSDQTDNNCDGLTDTEDPICAPQCVPTATKEKGKTCKDGIDNDCDGTTDSFDSDCGSTEEPAPDAGGNEGKGKSCSDGLDNDGDQLIDCADPGCSASRVCK